MLLQVTGLEELPITPADMYMWIKEDCTEEQATELMNIAKEQSLI